MRRGLTPSCYYPPEQEIAELILGPGRVCEWREMAVVLERHGLPQIDPMLGRRFWPAVELYFQSRHGLAKIQPGELGPTDGIETCPPPRQRKRQDSASESGSTVHRLTTGSAGET